VSNLVLIIDMIAGRNHSGVSKAIEDIANYKKFSFGYLGKYSLIRISLNICAYRHMLFEIRMILTRKLHR
jgi:hypothetical protein